MNMEKQFLPKGVVVVVIAW